jgi:mono/diheme cytochrome c family protein
MAVPPQVATPLLSSDMTRKVSFVAIALALGASLPARTEARLRSDLRGEQLYQRECAACHGPNGRGDGPEAASFAPPPRDLRDGFLRLYDPDELVARIRTGEPLTIEIDRAALRRRSATIEDILAHVRRLAVVRWDDIEAGSAIYAERCEECHGPFGRPLQPTVSDAKAGKPRDLSSPGFQRSTTDAQLLDLAQHGRADMPSMPPIARSDLNALRAYLRFLSPGFELYSTWCAGCHGDEGKGDGDFANGDDRPTVVFDRAFLAQRSAGELREQVQHMLEKQEGSMPHLQHRLSERDARMVIEYLLSKQSPSPSPTR